MKLLKKMFLAAVLVSASAQAQTVYKNQLLVSNQQFKLEGSLLRVKMRVSYDAGVLNSGDILNFIPVLKCSTHQQPLTAAVINGRERGHYEDRKARLSASERKNMPIIKHDDSKFKQYFDYETTIPYIQWMTQASLYVETEECGWKGSINKYEDKVIDLIMIDGASASPRAHIQRASIAAAPIEWIPFIEPTALALGREQTVKGQIALADSRQIGQMKDHNFLAAVYVSLKQSLAQVGGVVSQLSLHGFGAPIGNYQRNEQRSTQRAIMLKEFLTKQEIANSVSVAWTAEDWQSIMRMTQADAVIPLRSAAIDVMQGVSVANGREAQLQSLQGGHTYAMLKTHVFPRVQRIEYTAVIQHTASSTSTDAVNLRSLYQTASTFARGSKDYNDIIELAAQLYPDNAVAAINAAGVALTKGEKDKAEKYLSKWLTDPLAYQNLGVLYLLKGEQARAEVYLKKAAEMGVDEAAKMLHDGSLFL
jgi:hypothetical protein